MIVRLEAWPALMTRELAAAYISGSLRDIDEMKNRREITAYGKQKLIKFKKTDLDAWIEALPERDERRLGSW